jgi:hypothetical protein
VTEVADLPFKRGFAETPGKSGGLSPGSVHQGRNVQLFNKPVD